MGEHHQVEVEGFLRCKAVKNLAGGISTATLYRWCATGQFPKQVRIGPNTVAWRRSEVRAWLASRGVA
jgi:prophage regulatory protein